MKRLLGAAIVACLVLLAGCSSKSHTKTVSTSTTSSAVSPAPSCVGSSYHMQCAKNAPQAPPRTGSKVGATSLFGIDTYGAGNPNLPAAYDCAYLSGSPGGKDWTTGGIQAWLSHKKAVCLVWETYATRAEYGYGAGQQDAITARREAASLGVPTYVPIRFAVDTDTSANNVTAYFQGVRSVLGIRSGVYGSYYVVAGLEARGITTPRADWQTVAWSNGLRGRACLYQSSINHYLNGESVDFDQASCADFGQYPFAQKPVYICFGKHAAGSATCRKVHAEVAKWQAAAAASKRVFTRRGCPTLTRTRDILNQRWSYFWSQLRYHPRVQVAHRKAALAATGNALNKIRRAISGRSCLAFTGRASYFTGRIAAVKRQYS